MAQNLLSDWQSLGLQTSFRFSGLTSIGTFSDFGDIDINNRGVTAYSASASGTANNAITGIYTTRNGRRTETIATLDSLNTLFQDVTSGSNISNISYTLGTEIDINNQGDVVFEGRLTFTQTESTGNQNIQIERLFIKDGNQFRTLAEERVSNRPTSPGSGGIVIPDSQTRTIDIQDFSINDSDQLVYRFQESQGQGISLALVRDGQRILTETSTAGSGTATFQTPTIINDGSVYYSKSGGNFQDEDNIFRIASGNTTATPLISIDNDVSGFSVNEQGTVVFSGRTLDNSPGRFEITTGTFQIGSNGLTQINSTDALFVDVNRRDSVVTQSLSGSQAIVFERSNVEQTVIESGGTLNGLQVASLEFGALNDRNQLVFSTTFADGTTGIFRADLRRSFSSSVTLSSDEIAASDGEVEISYSTS